VAKHQLAEQAKTLTCEVLRKQCEMNIRSGTFERVVVGRWLRADGSPMTGRVSFVPSQRLVEIGSNFVIGEAQIATLDSTGAISLSLLCTDDPRLHPEGWAWTVTEQLAPGVGMRWSFVLPQGEAPMDLTSVAPIPNLAPTGMVCPPGVTIAEGDLRWVKIDDLVIPEPLPPKWPDRGSTGISADWHAPLLDAREVNIPGVDYDERGWWVVHDDNTIIEGFFFTGTVSIRATYVTIRNCRSRFATDAWAFATAVGGTRGLVIDHCDIGGIGDLAQDQMLVALKDNYGGSNPQVTNCYISNVSTGLQLDAGLIKGCLIEGLTNKGGQQHLNAIASNSGDGELLTIEGNVALCSEPQTGAVCLFQDFGPQMNRLVQNNLLAGGAYVIYGGDSGNEEPKVPTQNIRLIGNTISQRYYPQGGSEGPLAHFTIGNEGNVALRNYFDDGSLAFGGE
jgi:hypothetical protein